ncbi:MAG: hypothetical protein KDC33_09030 [Thermoleophilia bacterium]|nr:hypothetical protein [Thermoleophilia bacterium]
MPSGARRPTSYMLLGPPDILFDVLEDFADVGWRTGHAGWKAVVTAPAEEDGHAAPAWPVEVTLVEVVREGHVRACREHLA